MDRRDSIKSMLIGGLAGGIILTGCDTNTDALEEVSQDAESNAYGRT